MSRYHLVIGDKRQSSWSLRPWLLLRQLGLPFSETIVPLSRPETPAAIRRYSPSGRVPVLFDGDFAIWDSLAILEYLAEQHPERAVWPRAPLARARARSLAAEMHSGFAAVREELPFAVGRRHSGKAFGAQTAVEIVRLQQILEETRVSHGGYGEFLFGDFGAADAMFAPIVCRFVTYGLAVDGVVGRYMHTVHALPALRQWNAEAAADDPI